MHLLTFGLIAGLTLISVGSVRAQERGCCEDYCYDTDNERPQARRLGTKTAYSFVRGSQSPRQFYVPNCTPVKFWLLSRHGTRLPDSDKIKSMRGLTSFRDEVIKNYEERRTKPDKGALCDEDLELLKNWRWDANITKERAGSLTTQGWDDMKYLAINYQSAFPRLLENIYTPGKFQFRHTVAERTNASLKGFLEGLFGPNAYDHIQSLPPVEKDMLLKPFDLCPSWVENSNADDENSERNKFREGELYQKMLEDVSRRLGFKLTLSKKQVKLIYEMCRYDQAWSLDRPSAWCAAFTKAQINVIEYEQDLKYYAETGYGNEAVNTNVACELVKDLIRYLDNSAQPAVSAYFAHSATVQLLLTALDTFHDTLTLRADNFAQQSRRKWRISEISPFAANLAAIKYDCPNDSERTKIMFFLNQKPMEFPYCNVGLCNWSDVKRTYQRFASADCASTFCKPNGGSRQMAGLGAIALAVLGIIGQYY